LMMGSCLRTLFWSFLLLVMFLVMWGTVAVELLNPIVHKLNEEDLFVGCDRCSRAYASVFMACITLFQTVVAGDSWGLVAIPVIEEDPWTILIFAGVLITLVYGTLNLILAVVVDVFAEQRETDMEAKAVDLQLAEASEKKVLTKMFRLIDMDESGALSFSEFEEGAEKSAEFAYWLRVLDIDEADLEQLFSIVDSDGSGFIELAEFTDGMYRLKHTEAKTATRFVKSQVSLIAAHVVEQGRLLGHALGSTWETPLATQVPGTTQRTSRNSEVAMGVTDTLQNRHAPDAGLSAQDEGFTKEHQCSTGQNYMDALCTSAALLNHVAKHTERIAAILQCDNALKTDPADRGVVRLDDSPVRNSICSLDELIDKL